MSWTLTNRDTGGVYTFVEDGDVTVARLHTVSMSQKANARLIAAAPDMYAFIKDLLANYELGEKLDTEMTALLAKARGEQS